MTLSSRLRTMRELPEPVIAVALGKTDLTEMPSSTRAMLFVPGEKGRVVPLETGSGRGYSWIRLAVIGGASHVSNKERPEEFNHKVRAFLGV